MNRRLLHLLIVVVLFFSFKVEAQVTVSGAHASSNGSFATLKAAFDAINAQSQSDNDITISITDNTTETATASLTGAGGIWSTLSILPSGGASRTISGSVNGALISLNGVSNVTFDGLNSDANSLTISNTSTGSSASTISFINASTSNTITKCTILGSSTSTSAGIISFSTSTGLTGNNSNTISNNNISHAGADTDRPVNVIYSLGTSGKSNTSNSITNNNIYNFFKHGTASYGVNISSYSTDWTISGNSFYETAEFVPTSGVEYRAINIVYTSGNNFTISNNNIGGREANCGGSAWTKTNVQNNVFYAIYLSAGTGSASNIQGNTISNLSWANSSSASWYGIWVNDGTINIGTSSGNTLGAATGTGSITFTGGASGATLYGIYLYTNGVVDCRNNTIASITSAASSSTNATNFYGIYKYQGTGATTISSNVIGSTSTTNSIQTSSTSTSTGQALIGIYTRQVSCTTTLQSNTIANLTNATTNTTTSTQGTICGIANFSYPSEIRSNIVRDLTISNANNVAYTYVSMGSPGHNSICGIAQSYTASCVIEGNEVYNLTNNYSSFTGYIVGIAFSDFSTTGTINKNFIHDFSLNASTTNAKMCGLFLTTDRSSASVLNINNNIISLGSNSTAEVYGIYDYMQYIKRKYYFNTVNIFGSPTSGSLASYILKTNRDNNDSLIIRNNIFSNSRSNTGSASGGNYGIYLYGTSKYLSSYNCLYSPGTGGYVGYFNSNASTIFEWGVISSNDLNSKSVNPGFSNSTGSTAISYIPSNTALIGCTLSDVTTDYTAATRSYNSMGAYDYEVGRLNIVVTASAGTLSGEYSTLKAVFDKINDGTHQGAIDISLGTSTTETAACVLNASGTGSASYTSVLIYPSVSGTTIGGSLSSASLIDLNGADNITIDGRVNASGSDIGLTLFNTKSDAYSVVRFKEGAQNNTLKYCSVKGYSTTCLIYFHTSSGGTNSGNIIEYNELSGLSANIRPSKVVYSFGSASPNNNTGNTIRNNNFKDFFHRSESNSYGVNIADNSTDFTISNNSFFETTTFSPSTTTYFYGIYIYNTSNGNNFTITNNYFGGKAALCLGDPLLKASTSDNAFYAIRMNVGTSTASNIQGNVITNFDWRNAGSSSYRDWKGISVEAGKVNIGTTSANIIGASTGNSAILITNGGTAAFDFVGIASSSSGIIDCQNNVIGGITTAASNQGYGVNMYGIDISSGNSSSQFSNNIVGSTSTSNSIQATSEATSTSQLVVGINSSSSGVVDNNTIANLTNNTTNSTTSTQGTIVGIFSKQYDQTITNNTIRNLKIYNANNQVFSNPSHGSYTYGSIGGIVLTYAGGKATLTGNTIYNLSNEYASFTGEVIGINFTGFLGSAGTSSNVSKNFIHSLSAHASSTAASIYGIKISSAGQTIYSSYNANFSNNIISLTGNTASTLYGIYDAGAQYKNCNLYFNSIYIGGTPTAGTNVSYALYSNSTSNTRNFRNNIFANARSNGGSASGEHYAVFTNYTSNTNLTIDYNDYYVSGTGGVLGRRSTTNYATIEAWQGTTAQDANSLSSNPQFSSAGGTTANNYSASSSFLAVDITGFTVDYFGSERSSPTIMGAITAPLIAPTVQATEIVFSDVLYNRMTISWTKGDGSKRLVFVKQASSGTTTITDDVSYTANTVFGSGTQSNDAGWYCVFNGTGSSVTVTNLTASTAYQVKIIEANGRLYFNDDASNNPKSQTTLALDAPATQAYNVAPSAIAYSQMTLSWTRGNGDKCAVFVKKANTGTASPVNSTSYSASTTFASGTQIGSSGWYCVYNGTGTSVLITNIDHTSEYITHVCEYNEANGSIFYQSATATDNPKVQATTTLAAPLTQAINVLFSSVNYTQMGVSWTNGNGEYRAVFIKQADNGTASPSDNITYTANTVFASGTQIGTSGWYCIYNGTGTSVTVTGLAHSTNYVVHVVEYNGYSTYSSYQTASSTNNSKVQSSKVLATPSTQATNVLFSSVNYTQMGVSWSNGNGEYRAVFIKQADNGTASPSDNTIYTANTTFGSGTQVGTSGWYCIYNGVGTSVTVTGLTTATNYIVHVVEYNGYSSSLSYQTSSSTNNSNTEVTLSAITPTTQATNIVYSSVTYSQMAISWTIGNGNSRAVFVKAGISGTASPADNTTYTANTAFTSGTQIGSTGWYCVYNGSGTSVTVTGLTALTSYITHVVEYSGPATSEKYLTTSSSNNSLAQTTGETPTQYSFTNCSKTGSSGPSQSEANTAYSGTSLSGAVTVTNGIQKWIVPQTGTYTIEAEGAQGGTIKSGISGFDYNYPNSDAHVNGSIHSGGKGARIIGSFSLVQNDVLYILVGQMGGSKTLTDYGGGGGGASYVVKEVASSSYYLTGLNMYVEPLITAAGGGGGGDNGVTTAATGGSATLTSSTSGGATSNAQGGGGFSGNSTGGGTSFLNGGSGATQGGPTGGFGGGGGSYDGGGAGGGHVGGDASNARGGYGGLSYNNGTSQTNEGSYNVGQGSVTISMPSSSGIFWTGNTNTDWNTSGNWTNGVPSGSDDVTILATANNPIINEAYNNPATCNNLTINSSAVLTINATKALTVSGDITNNGVITLNSDATGNATLLNSGTFSGSGTYNAEQYLLGGVSPAGRSYYISSPTTIANSSVFAPNGTTTKMQSYSEASKAFSDITNSTTDLNPMEGYFVRLGSTATKTFTGGAFNTGSMNDASLTRTAGLKAGFNLVGNPYPSYLNWSDVYSASSNLETTIWFRTASANTVAGMTFDTYNLTGPASTNNNGGGAVTAQIPPCQAFWVRVSEGQTTGNIVYSNSMRSHQTGHLRSNTSELDNLLRLAILDGDSRDETLIIFNENATDNFEAYDSEKMMGTNVAQCYTTNNAGDMVINTFAPLNGIKSVPVGVSIKTTGTHSFTASDLSSFDPSISITLEDKTTRVFTDLRTTPSYSFQADAGADNGRFVVHFGLSTNDIQNQTNKENIIYSFDKSVYVNSITQGTIEITDLSGRIILSQKANPGMNILNVNAMGVYMVKLVNEMEVKVSKIVVK